MADFFKDLKIVELASVLAGPSVGMFFAELGAKVLKIENKAAGGDATRGWRLPGETMKGPSAYFCAVNFGKTYLQLDLRRDAHRKALYHEIADADIVISNYRDQTASKLKVDFDSLKQLKRDLIYLQLDGFDHTDRPAYDVVLQAETGWISMTGSAKGALAKMPVALIDVLAGHQLKEAALLALLKKMRCGEGSFVRCSLEKTALASLTNQATNYLMCQHVAKPMGTLHPNIAPYGDSFKTTDGKDVVLAVGSDAQFEKLCQMLGIEKVSIDPRYAATASRVQNRAELNQLLAIPIGKLNLEQLESQLQAHGIPYGVVRLLDEVLSSPSANEMVLEDVIEARPARRLSSISFTCDFLDA